MKKRRELIARIEAEIKDYRSSLGQVQQAVTLLNIRARSMALKREIERYKRGSGVEEQEAKYWKELQKLNDAESLNNLAAAVSECTDSLSGLKFSEGEKSEIQNSTKETVSLIKKP